ncbi:MAG: hypothetical protein DI589_25965 [Shinella sp.]|nr:MAG: hypothetical protein DI589_25965 [Shinella sp.]
MVFERYPAGGGERLLALALADCADHDGTNIYPSIETLAAMTCQSERAVQYQLRRMEESGWLILVNAGRGGRSSSRNGAHYTRRYRISPEWLKGADFAPFKKGADGDAKGCKSEQERVQNEALKGANQSIKGCNSFAPNIRATKSNQEHPTPRVGETPGMTGADIDREVSPLGALPPELDRAVLAQFVRHRRVSNRTLSVQGWLQILPTLKSIAAAGGDPNQSLRDAMAAGLSLPVIPKPGANSHGNHPQGSAAGVSELRAEYERRHGGGSAGRPSGAGRGPQAGEVIDGEYAVVG